MISHGWRIASKRVNVMPLGAGALAGTTFPIDREYVAEQLEFPAITRNSLDSVSDRDFAIEFLADSIDPDDASLSLFRGVDSLVNQRIQVY